MATVTLIDASCIFWTNWHATADQELSEAADRTVARVNHYRDHASPGDLIAVCCDSPPYWRRELLPEYKAHRAAAPPLALEQFERTKDRLRADGFLLWAAPGFEADDVIAFATVHADLANHDILIVSSDKDLLQLVGGRVRVYSPAAKATFDASAVEAKWGVGPERVSDLLALVGDTSDNVPGIPGIGPKTAAALLNTFGNLTDVLRAAADESDARFTKPNVRRLLVEHTERAKLSRMAIELRTDLPLDWQEIYADRVPVPLTAVVATQLDEEGETMEPEHETTAEPVEALTSPTVPPKPVVQPSELAPLPRPANAIAMRADEGWSMALEPRSAKGAWEVAGVFLNSKMYKAFGSQEAIYVALLRGRALGLDATSALGAFHLIDGKLAMHADLITALVLRSGKAEYFELAESTAKSASYATKRVGGKREHVMSFTIEDACCAGVVVADPNGRDGFAGIKAGSIWDKYRATMLRHRASTQLARSIYPDVVLGLYDPEELGGVSS